MTIPHSQAELNRWRDAIIEDEWIPKYELSQMGKRDRVRFAHLCRALLSDPSPVVQRVALEKLWERGDPNEAAQCAEALLRASDTPVPFVVWEVLETVRPPAALPTLLGVAEQGSHKALRLANRLAHTPEDRAHVLRIARDAVNSTKYAFHLAGLVVTRCHMSLRRWEDLLQPLARQYDEEAIIMLGIHASPRVIPTLREIVDHLSPNSVQAMEAARAIERIQERAHRANNV